MLPLVQSPLLWAVLLTLLLCWSPSTRVSGQSLSSSSSSSPVVDTVATVSVVGHLYFANYSITYSFDAVGDYIDGTGPYDTNTATYLLVSVVNGTRTFTNNTVTETRSITLLPPNSLPSPSNCSNHIRPYFDSTTTLFDSSGVCFSISPVLEETPSVGVVVDDSTELALASLSPILYDEIDSDAPISSFFDVIVSQVVGPVSSMTSSSSAGGPLSATTAAGSSSSSFPIDTLTTIEVSGSVTDFDWTAGHLRYSAVYSFEAIGLYIGGSGGIGSPTAAYLVVSVNGTRTFNAYNQPAQTASLTLLPVDAYDSNNNVIYPNFFSSPTGAKGLFDGNGLSFNLSQTAELDGVGEYGSINLHAIYVDVVENLTPDFTISIFSASVGGASPPTNSSYPAPPSSNSSSGIPMVPTGGMSSSSAAPPVSSLATIDVAGILYGDNYTVNYTFTVDTMYLDGSGPEGSATAIYMAVSGSGTRNVTNTTSLTSEVSTLTLLPAHSFEQNNNLLWPNFVPSDDGNVQMFDENGLSFQSDAADASQVNLYWNDQQLRYAESSQNSTTASYFLAAVNAAPVITGSSSSTGSSVPATGSVSSSTAAISVLGDPQFVGLRGQSFQVHGIDGAVYNLIVDRQPVDGSTETVNAATDTSSSSVESGLILVNARFRFLSSGRCPDISQPTNCWSHPGSYLGEVGVLSAASSRLHVVSGSWNVGFSTVTLNGQTLAVGSKVTADGLSVHVMTNHSLSFSIGNFDLTLDNSDSFINIAEVRVHHWSALSSHGLLGQTWRAPLKGSANTQLRHIEGEVDDYAEKNGELFGAQLVYGVDTAQAE